MQKSGRPIPALGRQLLLAAAVLVVAGSLARPAAADLICPNACSGHGACRFEGVFNPDREGWPWSRVCVCDPGWAAADCSRCAASDVCPGRGICRFGECRCPIGWQGEDCNVCYSSVACGEHGSCFEGACVCESGWSGIACEVPATGTDAGGQGVDR